MKRRFNPFRSPGWRVIVQRRRDPVHGLLYRVKRLWQPIRMQVALRQHRARRKKPQPLLEMWLHGVGPLWKRRIRLRQARERWLDHGR